VAIFRSSGNWESSGEEEAGIWVSKSNVRIERCTPLTTGDGDRSHDVQISLSRKDKVKRKTVGGRRVFDETCEWNASRIKGEPMPVVTIEISGAVRSSNRALKPCNHSRILK
jgi:hypothetical protein